MANLEKSDHPSLASLAAQLNNQFADQPADTVLRAAIDTIFDGDIALVSSFGTESAVLLHLAAQIDSALPILFIDTGKHFGETKRYRDILTQRLGLQDVRSIRPAEQAIAEHDPKGKLWNTDPDLCCHIRKVLPLQQALKGFDAWITGRKAYQGAQRANLPVFQADASHIKVNPLALWSKDDIDAYIAAHDLPRHPLEADGFASVGCMPCTDRVAPHEDPRAGRWRGSIKSECGIHSQPPKKLAAAAI